MSIDPEVTQKVTQLQPGASIVRKLGEGASAVVYEVRLEEGANAFLKYYFKSDADSVQYLKNESAILSTLATQPTISLHVPRLLASNESMILMQPVVEELKINQFTPIYLTQLVQVLRKVHQDVGIVHRDMQPDNVLRNATSDTILLIDWACSTKKNEPVSYDGTIFYAAQELIPLVFTEKQYQPKPAHDLESIIKILYHILNEDKVEQCDIDVCQLDEVSEWWNQAFNEAPWPTYLQAARAEDYDALLKIIEDSFHRE